MSAKAYREETSSARQGESTARISSALRKATREARNDILNSYGYHVLWLGQASRGQYVEQLHANWSIRRALEMHFDSLDGEFRVKNLANNEEKIFTVSKYVTECRRKAHILEADIEELTGAAPKQAPAPKAQELIDYMSRVFTVYSAGLLGVLYMLEETVAYGGPTVAKNLNRELKLDGKGTRYLRGDGRQKEDLWELRRSLDLITDFQTQVNVVTAAAITYGTYRDLIDPRAAFAPARSKRLN